jgi:hypothetical protein
MAAGTQTRPNEQERSAIEEQLERLLENPYFSHSKRFPAFLRFVVEHTLSGQTDFLKERTIGIEIFGRDPDYDTATDPIVRVTAAEIRKRIAQYYQEPGHENELRIALPAGSYVPQFHEAHAPAEVLAAAIPGVAEEPGVVAPAAADSHPRLWWGLSLVLAALLGAAAVYFLKTPQRLVPANSFWAPVLNGNDPVLFCIADQSQYSAIVLRDAADPSRQITLNDNLTAVIIDDLSPVVRVAGLLQSNGKKFSLKGEGTTNLMDLRAGPTIFVGAFDNAWTLRLTKPLRYHFENKPDMTELGIVDSTAPAQRQWMINRAQQMATNNYRDFAIIARFTDVTTGEIAIVVAGVSRGGTIAAGEFLTDSANRAQLQHIMESAGAKKNMELVLSTETIGGESGTPRVEATWFW